MAIENRGPAQIFGTAAGFAPVRNLIAIGDPNVHKLGDRWWMFVGAAHTGGRVNLFSASLPPGAPLSSDAWTITTEAGDPTRAAPLVEHPEAGRWDEFLRAPSYARGPADDETGICERIYFTGSQSVSEEERSFSIGVLERSGQGWRRREDGSQIAPSAIPSDAASASSARLSLISPPITSAAMKLAASARAISSDRLLVE